MITTEFVTLNVEGAGKDGRQVYVVASAVVALRDNDDGGSLLFIKGGVQITVSESPDEVMQIVCGEREAAKVTLVTDTEAAPGGYRKARPMPAIIKPRVEKQSATPQVDPQAMIG